MSRRRRIQAGVLPEYGGRDWLTLQRVSDACFDVENIVLTNDTSRALLDFVLATGARDASLDRAISLLNSGDLPTCYLAGHAETQLDLPICDLQNASIIEFE